jgi:hypothetical protein
MLRGKVTAVVWLEYTVELPSSSYDANEEDVQMEATVDFDNEEEEAMPKS